MLTRLHIKNLAIIDELDLDLKSGFSVLTGETGAGKSILIDAIGLIAGTRADPGGVRAGQEKAEITAEFDIRDAADALGWLAENELTDSDDKTLCRIRRVVYAEGRTRAFVNGNAVNGAQLKTLGECLIEIFGQSESQTLMRNHVQREILDGQGQYDAALTATRQAAAEFTRLQTAIAQLRQRSPRDPAQVDFLRFQLQELDALQLGDGELETLETEHRQLANAGRLINEGHQAQEMLYGGENSLYDQLSQLQQLLGGLASLHSGFAESLTLVDGAQVQVREAADSLKRQLGHMDLDPERLQEAERRLSAIHELARKHRIKAGDLPGHRAALAQELQVMEGAAGDLQALEARQEMALVDYRRCASKLTAARLKAAKEFGDRATDIIRTLGMAHAQFSIAVETDSERDPRPHGDDEIRFDFSANPGQPPRALNKVASGGELSRVSLALQVVAMQNQGAGTMIFDEVDAGIGGAIAEIVGQRLRMLGDQRQVLCVTHQAQVAAQGHHHYNIRKDVQAGQTFTRVTRLSEKSRVDELARMQGGVEISSAALSHAKDLLKRVQR